jgi:hypothetical protein
MRVITLAPLGSRLAIGQEILRTNDNKLMTCQESLDIPSYVPARSQDCAFTLSQLKCIIGQHSGDRLSNVIKESRRNN